MDKELLSFVDFLQSGSSEVKMATDIIGVYGMS
jgi:hypothetical protein